MAIRVNSIWFGSVLLIIWLTQILYLWPLPNTTTEYALQFINDAVTQKKLPSNSAKNKKVNERSVNQIAQNPAKIGAELWFQWLCHISLIAVGLLSGYFAIRKTRFWRMFVVVTGVLFIWYVGFPFSVDWLWLNIESYSEVVKRADVLIQNPKFFAKTIHMNIVLPVFFIITAIVLFFHFIVLFYSRGRT